MNGQRTITSTTILLLIGGMTLTAGCANDYQTITTTSGRAIETDKNGSKNEGGWIVGRTKDDQQFRIRESEVESVVGQGVLGSD